MPGLHCELEHIHVAVVIDIMFLKFLETHTHLEQWTGFSCCHREYFVLHSIYSSTGATLGPGNSLASTTKTWLMD